MGVFLGWAKDFAGHGNRDCHGGRLWAFIGLLGLEVVCFRPKLKSHGLDCLELLGLGASWVRTRGVGSGVFLPVAG